MIVAYTKRAERALDEIAQYTLEEWGPVQAEHYLAMLEHACGVLAPQFAGIARVAPNRKDLRMLRCERHVIYFRSIAGGIEIVHVLHERQLPRKHL